MTLWYLARGAGLAAVLLLSVSTALGAWSAGRGTPADRVVLQYAHRASTALGLGALILHLTTILADSYARVGWLSALVPFSSAYRPLAVGLGTLAAYTFVAVAALGLARGRMAATPFGSRVWRRLHALGYAGWALGMVHGVLAGTDTAVGWVRLLYIGCAAGVAGAVAARLAVPERRRTHNRVGVVVVR